MSDTAALEQAAANAAVTETPAPAPSPAPVPLADLEDLAEYRERRSKGETGLEAPAEPKPAEQPAAEGQQPVEGQAEGAEQVEADGEQPGGKKRTVKERIGDLTGKWRETERQLEAERAEKARIAAELEALRAGKPPAPEQQQPELPAGPLTGPKPKIEDFDGQDDPWGAYVEALADWKTRETIAAREIAYQRAQQQAAYTSAQGRVEAAAKAAYQDFEQVIEAFAGSGRKFSPIVTDVILNHDQGHAVAYALAKDPTLNDRISSLPPAVAMLEIGKVLSRLESAQVGSAPAAAPVTKAPEPIRPVVAGAQSATAAPDPSSIESVSEWRRVRKQFER